MHLESSFRLTHAPRLLSSRVPASAYLLSHACLELLCPHLWFKSYIPWIRASLRCLRGDTEGQGCFQSAFRHKSSLVLRTAELKPGPPLSSLSPVKHTTLAATTEFQLSPSRVGPGKSPFSQVPTRRLWCQPPLEDPRLVAVRPSLQPATRGHPPATGAAQQSSAPEMSLP